MINCKKVAGVGLIISSVFFIGCGIYKVTPKIKKWWNERNHEKIKDKELERKN